MPTERVPTILVVEDEILIRLHVADHLRDCGLRVIEAGDGREALDVLNAAAPPVDLVFTDITLPNPPDGFELAEWIRIQKGLPVILASGGHNAAKAGELCVGAPFYQKPYDLDDLTKRIQAILGVES